MSLLLHLIKKIMTPQIQNIDDWIADIELSGLTAEKQQIEIKNVTDVWKFTEIRKLDMISPDRLLVKNSAGIREVVNVQCVDFISDKDIARQMLNEIEEELSDNPKYIGRYHIDFYESKINFNQSSLLKVKHEIIAAIKGELITYNYVSKIVKMPSESLMLHANNFKILECNIENIKKLLKKALLDLSEPRWLIIVLSSFDNNCNYFYFNQTVFTDTFEHGFNKVFLFDFYKSEIVELGSKVLQEKV